MALDLPELKNEPVMDFNIGDILDIMETDSSAPNLSSPEVEIEMKNERFEPVSDDEIQRLIDSQKNPNTRKNTTWAIETFNKWRAERDNVPLLTEMNSESLNYWMQRFVLEVRKQDGSEYPPRSLYYIVCGLLRFIRDENIHNVNFLDEKDHRFAVFQRVLDARMKELLSKGLGTKVRQVDPILPENEEKIWNQKVFGMQSSLALQYTVFFYNCKLFGLRGYDEHKSLKCDQFEVGCDERGKYIRFHGRSSKTYKGGLKHIQLQNKDIKHYCLNGKPLAVGIRYGEQVLGINKIKGLMKEITGQAGLLGNFTNHSGKRTCATHLYQAGVDEQEIMSRTGHRSETAVRKYKRSNSVLLENVSKVLDPPKMMKFEEPLPPVINQENLSMNDSKEFDNQENVTRNPQSVFNNCVFNFKP
ncbi:uncharacterized protein LOC125680217 [Ostrea edulis]|uniref:uncharacterized protein LOC125680217 n=1 Tax=Ostrea edulis TaxID=37623 RepID=UPI0024AEC67A|nr:uncharacterized protein LOC125680217 [Ostrea edulis]